MAKLTLMHIFVLFLLLSGNCMTSEAGPKRVVAPERCDRMLTTE
ncbi:hypothetical protein Lalb_Chr03g0039721 [Lupinus albus]|uniref:Uncharacterized protein n=1 Tax=Lupinus albus TaxID=3870 RepID=A0A6A4QVF2_LUPAL|nr:hypothetical protein Lalb_Chr03g0039721 [Lupinus albus]